MTGYSWVSVIALVCYLFLLLTFFQASKTDKVIRSFMTLIAIMFLWVGGSFFMRSELGPSVYFWHHVSVLGIMLVAVGYYHFALAFLEDKNSHNKWFWLFFHLALFIANLFTGIFIPKPVVIRDTGATQFIYNYTWHFYILLACLLLCVLQLAFIIYRHCKGNVIAFRQLRPVFYGLGILIIGHIAASFSVFSGIPLDIISGVINAFFLFYALYKKRLFKISLLFSRSNSLALAMITGTILAIRFFSPVRSALRNGLNASLTAAVILTVLLLVILVAALFLIFSQIFNYIVVRKEKRQENRKNQLAEKITYMLDLDSIMQNMTNTIRDITHIDRMLVFLRQTDGDYRVEYTSNPLDEKNYYIRADHPLVAYFKNHDAPINVQDFSKTTMFRSLWETEKQLLKSLNADCFIPIITVGDLVGIIMLPREKEGSYYRSADIYTAHAVASICSASVKDACAYERAIEDARRDKLTGLINRKYFFELLDAEFKKCKDSTLSLSLLNLDNFRQYNQVYGTQEGDIALQRIAGLLSSSLSEASSVARIGGKEFAIILPGYDIHFAKLITENLVAEISHINERSGGHIGSRITVSAGISAAPYMASSARELFQNAETAVYTVKRSGKNAVQIYSSDILYQTTQQEGFSSGYKENASTIYALTAAIDAKDHYTFRHSQNVAYYAEALGKAAGLANDLTEIVKEAALLHDIGKIGIREDILNKPGRLTPDEFDIMKGHVENAVNIIRHLPSLNYVIPTVLSHHEHFDGSGYPRRLSGESIPLMGRILCIADSFDAMTSERSYKKALDLNSAIENLMAGSGKQFDPKLVLIFVEQLKSGSIRILGQSSESIHPLFGEDYPENTQDE